MSGVPWVEKYRPVDFDKIVLESGNKQILGNVLKTNRFPNLLIYGPPGTGKTTTVINLIKRFHILNKSPSKGLVIHLNASDERGIDIIRNQITQFVGAKPLFTTGVKFVILDEVDYMTKSAQQALKYLLREVSSEVRFCLICNYISRIDETLQNGFVRLRFNKLPENQIISFLRNICAREKISITDETLYGIRRRFVNDIRSMINYIQMNNSDIDINIVNPVIWDGLFSVETMSDPRKFRDYFERASDIRNTSKRSIIKNLMNYIIRERPQHTGPEILVFFEKIMHNCECPDKEMNEYFIGVGYELFKANCGGGGGGSGSGGGSGGGLGE